MADETLAEALEARTALNQERLAYKKRVEALQAEKATHQAVIADINATLQTMQAAAAADKAAYIAERDRLSAIIAAELE